MLRDFQSRALGGKETEAAQEILRGAFGLKEIQERAGQEARRRFRKLGELEGLADLHSKNGFSVLDMTTLMEENGFEVVQIKTRIQYFMTTFSRLRWPYKSIAILDFMVSEVPILNKYLPSILCIARKRSDGISSLD